MKLQIKNNLQRGRRKARTRAKLFGTKTVPRLSVFRSNKYTYAQLIDDEKKITLISLSTKKIKAEKKKPVEVAKVLGEKVAHEAKTRGIKSAIFDRGSYKYHGKVKALAEAARGAGLKF